MFLPRFILDKNIFTNYDVRDIVVMYPPKYM